MRHSEWTLEELGNDVQFALHVMVLQQRHGRLCIPYIAKGGVG
jgi:hypothetical protein